jgi:hypothetical protein
MKQSWILLSVTSILACVSLILSLTVGLRNPAQAGDAKGGPVYAQLSSAVSQKPKSTEPTLALMESNDAVAGIGHDPKVKTAEVTVKTAGVYFIVAAAQVGRDTGVSDDFVDMWVRQNGKDVDNSNTRQTIKDTGFTSVLVCQGIAECKAGDVINVAYSVSAADKGLGIIATSPKVEPVIPSIIFSMYKIN